MGYRIDNRPVDLAKLKRLKFAPGMKVGDTYRYKNCALRVFKEQEVGMPLETAEYLTEISTGRILLPKHLLFYNNAFKGYTMKLVSNKGAGKRLITTPSIEVIDSIRELEKDVETVSDKKVLLNNLIPGYTLYNGELYVVNPADYSILEQVGREELHKLNAYQLHLLITELIIKDMHKSNEQSETINKMREILRLKDNDESSSSYMKQLLKGQDSIKTLVKKIG